MTQNAFFQQRSLSHSGPCRFCIYCGMHTRVALSFLLKTKPVVLSLGEKISVLINRTLHIDCIGYFCCPNKEKSADDVTATKRDM